MELEIYREMIAAQASHWWFRGRRRIVSRLLRRFVPAGGRVLEVGAGTGANLAMLAKWGSVTALEPEPFAADHLSRHFDVRVVRAAAPSADIARLGAFRLAVALDVLEHIDDDAAALDGIVRALRPGGWLLVTVPAFGFLWSSHDEVLHHKRRYRKSELDAKLKAAGLTVEFVSYFNVLLFAPAMAVRLAGRRWPAMARAGTGRTPAIVNRCLAFVFGIEAYVLGRVRLPFGLSIVALARKPA